MNGVDMSIEVMLMLTGMQRKIDELTIEMGKATLVINQQQDNIETLQVEHDKVVDIVQLQAELNVKNRNAILRLEGLQKLNRSGQ